MTASFFCPHKPRLWSQVGRCDYRYKFLQTTWTEAPQHFLKTRVVLMLIIPVISSSYLPQHRHHRNPLMKPLKSPWYNSMICGWTSSKFLILSHRLIRVNILLIKSYDMIILQIYINFTLKCYYNQILLHLIFRTWQRGFHEGLKLFGWKILQHQGSLEPSTCPWQPNWKSHVMKQIFGRSPVTRTLKGNEKQFK